MDTSAREIIFDVQGRCSYCETYLTSVENILEIDEIERTKNLNSLISEIKQKGKGKKYDCIIGVSGGVDSSWVLVKAVEHGLRPLAVHMDNGWDSELAQNNISNLVTKLGVDLYTHVIDWTEYRKLMQAFFDADVIDVELLYDNAMLAVNYKQAIKHRTNFILSGSNTATEGMIIPPSWNWYKYDSKNIVSISKKMGNVKIKTFPKISTFQVIFNQIALSKKWVAFLDLFPYNKEFVLNELESKYGYKRYPYKHYESVFTRFYQGYLLPTKFKVDKRRLHLSTLIISGQLSREEALVALEQIPYSSEQDLENDIEYFLKKMRWTDQELDNYLSRPEVKHDRFPNENKRRKRLKKLRNVFLRNTDQIAKAIGE